MVFACNELPVINDDSKGFYDRWIKLDFPYTFVPQDEYDSSDNEYIKLRDPNIIEKINTQDQLDGLFNWALEGLDRLLESGDFSGNRNSDTMRNFWRKKSNSLRAFVDDCIEEDDEEYMTKEEFRQKYHIYCKTHNLQGVSDQVMKRTLEKEYGITDAQKRIDEEKKRIWCRIKLKEGLPEFDKDK